MAQFIQLQLRFAPASLKEQESDMPRGRKVIWEDYGLRMLTPTKKAGKDPCRNCWAKGLCDSDECARKLYPVDVNEFKPINYNMED